MNYSEGIFVGYRGYDKSATKPLFPFGFGLSYTTFAFKNISVSPARGDLSQPVKVSFDVTNTGNRVRARRSPNSTSETRTPGFPGQSKS